MHDASDIWAIVLAAGDGARVRDLARADDGQPAPKQFCRFGTDRTLLGRALTRAANVATPEHVVVVVANAHRPWWEPELRGHPLAKAVAQPRNRGTAAGLLLPMFHVLALHPRPIVVVIPSDHVFDDEEAVAGAIREAVRAVRERPRSTVLLGMAPDGSEGQFGWIIPGSRPGSTSVPIRFFVEKPSPPLAASLASRGGLRNSFLIVSTGEALLGLYRKARPALLAAFLRVAGSGPVPPDALERIYDTIEETDFSRDILERAIRDLEVVPVPECGWRDLGTPAALADWLFHQLEAANRVG
jgi:mannose-1-phosphate guanylyltransferase